MSMRPWSEVSSESAAAGCFAVRVRVVAVAVVVVVDAVEARNAIVSKMTQDWCRQRQRPHKTAAATGATE